MTSRRQLHDERMARASRRMSAGSLGGRTEQAQPQGVRPTVTTKARASLEIVTFNVVEPMATGLSRKYRVMRGGALTLVTFQADAAGTTTTTFRFVVDGSVVGSSVSVGAATLEYETMMASGIFVPTGAIMRAEITASGGHDYAVIQAALAT